MRAIGKHSDGEKVTWIGLVGNIILTGLKALCGIFGKSEALIADTVHSASDIAATLTVLLGLKIAKRPKDSSHPYGHGRIESITAFLVGAILIVAAVLIVREAAHSIFHIPKAPPNFIAIAGVLVSIIVKEWMFRYTLKAGKRLNSPSIIANAWDHRSDAYSSAGVFLGIVGAKIGLPILDPIAAGVVAIFIFKVGFEIVQESFHDLMDTALSPTITSKMRILAKEIEGVLAVTEVKGRRMGAKIIADIKITVDGFSSAKGAHDIALRVEKHLIQSIPQLVEVMIHVDVEERRAEEFRSLFERSTKEILREHDGMFLEIHELDYHFAEQGKEIHFHMVVPEGISFEEAHALSKHLEEEIQEAFPGSAVVIHMEPASEGRRRKNAEDEMWETEGRNT